MRPNRVIRAAARFTATGIEYIHIIYFTVAVTIILGKVDLIVEQLTCFYNHIGRSQVVAAHVISTVVGHIM